MPAPAPSSWSTTTVFTAEMEKLSPAPKAAPRAKAKQQGSDQHHGQTGDAAVDVADVFPGDARARTRVSGSA